MTDQESMPGSDDLIRQVNAMVRAGELRAEIPCSELRTRWFEMARDMYVADIRGAVPGDYEIGVHLGQCAEPGCQLLARAYWALLRPSLAEDAAALGSALDALEQKVRELGGPPGD
jgi:hypothetical protein